MPSQVVPQPADALAPARLHAAFAAAFSDYLIGPFTLPLDQWPVFLGRQGVDLALSRVMLENDSVLAFTLVAPRPALSSWRLAVMGAPPAARGGGAARALLDDFLVRAAAAGARRAELECFAQNERALRLYKGRGFEPVRALHGYARGAGASLPPAPAGPAAEPVALAEAWDWLDARAAGLELPLQVTGVSLRTQPTVPLAWRRGGAQLVAHAAGETVTVQSLVDPDPAQHDAQALAAHLLHAFPRHRIAVPQLQRRDLGGDALQRLGFETLPLHQVWMRRAL